MVALVLAMLLITLALVQKAGKGKTVIMLVHPVSVVVVKIYMELHSLKADKSIRTTRPCFHKTLNISRYVYQKGRSLNKIKTKL